MNSQLHTNMPEILIVEDENIIAMDLQYRLEDLGYKVAGMVSSGEASIDAVSRRRPDLVLMDIKLRGRIDGVRAAELIFRRFHVPVVYLSSIPESMAKVRTKKKPNKKQRALHSDI